MFDPSTIEVRDTSVVHMKDAKGKLLYDGGTEEAPEPVTITLYGPGSAQFQAASDARIANGVTRRQKVGDTPKTGDELRDENITFLLAVTAGCSTNLEAGGGNRAFFEKIYRNPKLGFWYDQLQAELQSWGNFTDSSPTT